MTGMAGDPQTISTHWCNHCNCYHTSCNNNSTYFAVPTVNKDAEILALLQKILSELENMNKLMEIWHETNE
jgi:NMD protein affecting ribosome stability and mRNA decay